MNEKNILFTENECQELTKLIGEFDVIWGNEDTIWTFNDLDSFREIGQEVISILRNKLIDNYSNNA